MVWAHYLVSAALVEVVPLTINLGREAHTI